MDWKQPPCPSGRFWMVKEGDTLYKIAEQLGIHVGDLVELNPGVDPDNLQVGTSLCLPPELPPCASGIYWRVTSGDTLYNIALATGTTIGKLLELNPGLDPLDLRINQAICLPPLPEIGLKTQIIDKKALKNP